MKLILVRHGETIENIKGIVQGHIPGRLSNRGKNQAKKVAKRLKNEKIDYAYCSDLKRAADTAKEIMKYHKHTPFKLTKELREAYFGDYEGKLGKNLNWKVLPKNIETIPAMYKRARKFLDKTIHNHRNDDVLLVTHGGIGRAIVGIITKQSHKKYLKMERLHNTSITIFKIYEDKRHKIHLFNDIGHLSKKEAQYLKKKYASY